MIHLLKIDREAFNAVRSGMKRTITTAARGLIYGLVVPVALSALALHIAGAFLGAGCAWILDVAGVEW